MQIYTTKKFSYENILSETAGGNLPVQSQKGVLHDPSQKIILIKIIVIIIKNSKIMEGFQIKKITFSRISFHPCSESDAPAGVKKALQAL